MAEQSNHKDLLDLTTQIVAAHVGNNAVHPDEVQSLIQKTYKTLSGLGQESSLLAERPQPAVPIRKSVTPDHIICLEDGKQLKMLKRHLKTAYGMTPDDYRQRWGLPSDYPMVAPNYAKQRSALAKEIGLGTSKGRK